jgi:hypothetical protein
MLYIPFIVYRTQSFISFLSTAITAFRCVNWTLKLWIGCSIHSNPFWFSTRQCTHTSDIRTALLLSMNRPFVRRIRVYKYAFWLFRLVTCNCNCFSYLCRSLFGLMTSSQLRKCIAKNRANCLKLQRFLIVFGSARFESQPTIPTEVSRDLP